MYGTYIDYLTIVTLKKQIAELESRLEGATWKGYKEVCEQRDQAIETIKDLNRQLSVTLSEADRLVDKIEEHERTITAYKGEIVKWQAYYDLQAATMDKLKDTLKSCVTSENAHCFSAGTIGMMRRIQAINEIVEAALKETNNV